MALPSLLDELRTIEDSKIFRSTSLPSQTRSRHTPVRNPIPSRSRSPIPARPKLKRSCTLCKTAKRHESDSHWLRQCPYLTEGDKRALANARASIGYDETSSSDDPEGIVDDLQYALAEQTITDERQHPHVSFNDYVHRH